MNNYQNSHCTNCLTKLNRNIKAEINDGTLTLKAGSVVYVPRGLDGSEKIFEAVTVPNDIVNTDLAASTSDIFFWQGNDKTLSGWPYTIAYAGATRPSLADSVVWAVFYSTVTNTFEARLGNTTWVSVNFSLPVCVCESDANSKYSFRNIFNGFGFIGSCVFLLPGAKGLIPNGFNEDGSYKNTEVEITSVSIVERSGTDTIQTSCSSSGSLQQTYLYYTSSYERPTTNWTIWHNLADNKMYACNATANMFYPYNGFHIGTATRNSNKIVSDITLKPLYTI